MFKPTITEEWLLATMEQEGDGFVNAGGIRSEMPDSETPVSAMPETTFPSEAVSSKNWNAESGALSEFATVLK